MINNNTINDLANKYAKPEITDLNELEVFLNDLVKGISKIGVNVDFLDADNWDFISDFKIDRTNNLLYLYWHQPEFDLIDKNMRKMVFPFDRYGLIICFKSLEFIKDKNNICFALIIRGQFEKKVIEYLKSNEYKILDTNSKDSLFSVDILCKKDGVTEYLRFLNTPISSFWILSKEIRILPQESQKILYQLNLKYLFNRIEDAESALVDLDKSSGIDKYENRISQEGNSLRRIIEALYKLIICFHYTETNKTYTYNSCLGVLEDAVKRIYTEKEIKDSMQNIVKVLHPLSHDSGICFEKGDLLKVIDLIKQIACKFYDDINHEKDKYKFTIDMQKKILLKKYITENKKRWNFIELISEYQKKDNPANNIEFRIKWEEAIISHPLTNSSRVYLGCNGYFNNNINPSELFILHNRELAITFCQKLFEIIQNECQNNGYDTENLSFYCNFDLEPNRIGKPTHLFTKEEIRNLILGADDNNNNQLVVNENGYAQMISYPERGHYYPVSIETFCSGNGYVGEEPHPMDLEGCYGLMLILWCEYLKTGKSHYDDCYVELKPEEKQILIEKINKYY